MFDFVQRVFLRCDGAKQAREVRTVKIENRVYNVKEPSKITIHLRSNIRVRGTKKTWSGDLKLL